MLVHETVYYAYYPNLGPPKTSFNNSKVNSLYKRKMRTYYEVHIMNGPQLSFNVNLRSAWNNTCHASKIKMLGVWYVFPTSIFPTSRLQFLPCNIAAQCLDILTDFMAIQYTFEDCPNTMLLLRDGARTHRTADVIDF